MSRNPAWKADWPSMVVNPEPRRIDAATARAEMAAAPLSRDLDAALARITTALRLRFAADDATIFLRRAHGGRRIFADSNLTDADSLEAFIVAGRFSLRPMLTNPPDVGPALVTDLAEIERNVLEEFVFTLGGRSRLRVTLDTPEGERLGLLSVCSRQPGAFGPDDLAEFQELAALAVATAHCAAISEQLAAEHELVECQARVLASLAPGASVEEVATVLATEARALFHATHALVSTFELVDGQRDIRIEAIFSDHLTLEEVAAAATATAENQGVYDQVRAGIPESIPDLTTDRRGALARLAFERGLRSYVRVPIRRDDGAVIGLVAIGNTERDAYTAADVTRLTELATIVGFAGDKARLVREERERAQTVGSLIHMLGTLDAAMPPAEVARMFAAEVRTLIKADSVMVHAFDRESGVRTEIAYVGDEPARLPARRRLAESTSYSGLSREPTAVYDRSAPARAPRWLRNIGSYLKVGSAIAVRLDGASAPVGLIAAGSWTEGALGPAELRILEDLAHPLAMLLERAKLVDALQLQSARMLSIVEILAALGSRETFEEMATPVATALRAMFAADHCVVGTVDGEDLVIRGMDSLIWEGYPPSSRVPLARVDGYFAAAEHGTDVVADLTAPEVARTPTQENLVNNGVRSVVRAAIPGKAGPIGFVSVASRTTGWFSAADARQLGQIVQPLGVTVRYFEGRNEALERSRRLDYSTRILTRLSSGGSRRDLATGFLAECRELFDAEFAMAVGFEGGRSDVSVLGIDTSLPEVGRFNWPDHVTTSDIHSGAFQRGDQPRVIHDSRLGLNPGRFHSMMHEAGLFSTMRAPLATEDTIGAVTIWARGTNHFSDDDARLLSTLTRPFAIALEKRSAIDALAESERKYRSLVAQAEEMIYLVDRDSFTILEANAYTAHALGYEPGELLGLPLRAFLEIDSSVGDESIRVLNETGELHLADRCYRRKDGSIFEADIVASIVSFGGRDAILVLARDISERKALQQQVVQAQKMDSLGTMAGYVAHDFNNLLTTIMGFAGLIKRSTYLDEEDRDNLRMIEDAAHRAAELTGRLLSFARGGLVHYGPVDLRTVVTETLALCQPTITANLRIVTNLPSHPVTIEGDPGQLQQAVLNIVLNARDALGGTGEITITARQDGRDTYLSIADNGPGMSEAVRNRIFEPFFSTKPSGSGTGLGLAITYGIVQGHHGDIQVDSKPGEGTTFTLKLPTAHIAGTTGAAAAEAGSQPTVLIVDDDELVGQAIAGLVGELGYTPVELHSGAAVLEYITAAPRDIAAVILDLVMPGMSGSETCAKIRALRPGLPIFVSTGYAAEAHLDADLRSHVRAILAKPMSLESLAKALEIAVSV